MSASAPLTPRQIFNTLDAISRTRALSEIESGAMIKAKRAVDEAGGNGPTRRRWEAHELAAVRLVLGHKSAPAVLAPVLGRTPEAIKECMRRLIAADLAQQSVERRAE